MGQELTMTNVLTEPPDPRTRSASAPPPVRPPRHPGRAAVALWRIFAAVIVIAGLVWGTYSAITLLAHEERVENETFAAAGIAELDVRTSNGSVRIVATDTAEISVRAEISEGLRRTGERREVVNGVLELHATCPLIGSTFCWVDYEVRVPRDLPLTVHADSGRITVTGSDAGLVADGDDGSIELSDLSGTIDARTDHGRVEGRQLRSGVVRADSDSGRVVLEFVAAPTAVEATSNHGSVEVIVPDDGEAYRVTMDTEHGREQLDVRTDPASARSLVLVTDHGDVTASTAP
jgi:Putative adhesin